MNQPREYTSEEIREKFLTHVNRMIEYWEREERAITHRDKLEGLAHSIMATIDGCTHLPAFILAPLPHKDDRAFNISNGENYFPRNDEKGVNSDIGGSLSYQLLRVKERLTKSENPAKVS